MLVAADGMYYTSHDGREILDGTAGLWCCNAGHKRPKIIEAVNKQMETMDYAPAFQMGHPAQFELASRLTSIMPGDLNHVFYTNSGSEAVETALKIALAYHRANGEGHRTRLIGREKGYHGVNFGGMSVGGINIIDCMPRPNIVGLTEKAHKDPKGLKRIESYPVLYPFKINSMAGNQKYFIGATDDGTCVYKGVVEFNDGSIYTDEGSANESETMHSREKGKQISIKMWVLETASTRAKARALRSATGIGLVSAEELQRSGVMKREESPLDKESQKLIESIKEEFKAKGYNEAKKQAYCRKHAKVDSLEKINYTTLQVMAKSLTEKLKKAKKKAVKKKTVKKKTVKKKVKKNK